MLELLLLLGGIYYVGTKYGDRYQSYQYLDQESCVYLG